MVSITSSYVYTVTIILSRRLSLSLAVSLSLSVSLSLPTLSLSLISHVTHTHTHTHTKTTLHHIFVRKDTSVVSLIFKEISLSQSFFKQTKNIFVTQIVNTYCSKIYNPIYIRSKKKSSPLPTFRWKYPPYTDV